MPRASEWALHKEVNLIAKSIMFKTREIVNWIINQWLMWKLVEVYVDLGFWENIAASLSSSAKTLLHRSTWCKKVENHKSLGNLIIYLPSFLRLICLTLSVLYYDMVDSLISLIWWVGEIFFITQNFNWLLYLAKSFNSEFWFAFFSTI